MKLPDDMLPGEYLEQLTKRYTFLEKDGAIQYDGLRLFDVGVEQPEMKLHKIRFKVHSRANCAPNTFHPSRDPSSG